MTISITLLGAIIAFILAIIDIVGPPNYRLLNWAVAIFAGAVVLDALV